MEKVTMFIFKEPQNEKFLAIKHPCAGYQIPSGTVEKGENPLEAAVRELEEETGITRIKSIEIVNCKEEHLAPKCIVIGDGEIYSRPYEESMKVGILRRGLTIEKLERESGGFQQVRYREYDDLINPQYVSCEVLGWIKCEEVSDVLKRHYIKIQIHEDGEESQRNFTDGHEFTNEWLGFNEKDKLLEKYQGYFEYINDFI